MSFTNFEDVNVKQPEFKLLKNQRPISIPDEKMHTKLLDYLKCRLASDQTRRSIRLQRFCDIDRTASTWQKLTPEDSQRANRQRNTGKSQAIHMNLPMVQTHTDDMVSFYAGVYSPTNGSFFESVSADEGQQLRPIVDQMNAYAVKSKYYKNLSQTLRDLVKYNIGGLLTRWVYDTQDELGFGDADWVYYGRVDMYNVLWDPAIADPSDIAKKAEWAAITYPVTRRWLIERELEAIISGAGNVISEKGQSNQNKAKWYKYPPSEANISFQDAQSDHGSGMSEAAWKSYGVSLQADSAVDINGHEIVEMYCWLRAKDFRLKSDIVSPLRAETYTLWRFLILDDSRIILAVPFDRREAPDEGSRLDIPMYLGYMLQDNMLDAQRSTAELLAPFQNYGSFLLNSNIDQVKSEIFGLRVYDPSALDMSQVTPGSTAQDIPSKAPGRDVKTIIQKVSGTGASRQPLQDLEMLMGLMQRFFPAQAMPSQIAGIDRAVTQQVTALIQGVNRRLQMTMRILDDDILGPARFAGYVAALNDPATAGLQVSDDLARKMIGSGVMQLNREMAASSMQQLIFALIQNPDSAQRYDVPRLFDIWSRMMNMEVTLSDVVRQEAPPEQQQQVQ